MILHHLIYLIQQILFCLVSYHNRVYLHMASIEASEYYHEEVVDTTSYEYNTNFQHIMNSCFRVNLTILSKLEIMLIISQNLPSLQPHQICNNSIKHFLPQRKLQIINYTNVCPPIYRYG